MSISFPFLVGVQDGSYERSVPVHESRLGVIEPLVSGPPDEKFCIMWTTARKGCVIDDSPVVRYMLSPDPREVYSIQVPGARLNNNEAPRTSDSPIVNCRRDDNPTD